MIEAKPTPPPFGLSRALIALWAAGLALRLAFIWLEPTTAPVADETMWLMALTRIPAAGFSPFSNYPIFHPPLYPYFLASLNSLFSGLLVIKIVQGLIGSLLIPVIHRITFRISGGRSALAAAAIAAFYPELIWYASHFWCETLFLTFFWIAVERVLAADETGSRKAALAAGALFGVAILTRETLLYLLPVALIWLAWPKPRRWTLAALLAGSVFLIVAPWTVRNWIQFEAFIPVSTGGGLNLYQGNAGIQRGEVYDEYYANEGKVEQFQWARAAGLRAIWKRQPAWIFEKIRDEGPRLAELDSLALIHLRRGAYGPEVSCAAYRGVAFIVLVPWILIAMASVVALARAPMNRGTVLLLALLGAYLLLHIATHGFSRYRLPVLPAFMILAASLFGFDCATARSLGRRLLLAGLTVALALLWAPSLVDQMGHLGFAPPPAYEGFAPLCPAPTK